MIVWTLKIPSDRLYISHSNLQKPIALNLVYLSHLALIIYSNTFSLIVYLKLYVIDSFQAKTINPATTSAARAFAFIPAASFDKVIGDDVAIATTEVPVVTEPPGSVDV